MRSEEFRAILEALENPDPRMVQMIFYRRNYHASLSKKEVMELLTVGLKKSRVPVFDALIRFCNTSSISSYFDRSDIEKLFLLVPPSANEREEGKRAHKLKELTKYLVHHSDKKKFGFFKKRPVVPQEGLLEAVRLISENYPFQILRVLQLFSQIGFDVKGSDDLRELKNKFVAEGDIFHLFSSYIYLDEEEDRKIAKERLRKYSAQHGIGPLLFRAMEGMNYDDLVCTLFEARESFKVASTDPYLNELRNIFDASSKESRNLIIQFLLVAYDDPSATSQILITPPIKIPGFKLELRSAKDVVMLAAFSPHYITTDVVKQLAANGRVIEAMNKTLKFFNTQFVTRESYDLFRRINAASRGVDKIDLRQLLSFEELVKMKAKFRAQAVAILPAIAESRIYAALCCKHSTFEEFYKSLPESDCRALGIFIPQAQDWSVVFEWLKKDVAEFLRGKISPQMMAMSGRDFFMLSPAEKKELSPQLMLKQTLRSIEALESTDGSNHQEIVTCLKRFMEEGNESALPIPPRVADFYDRIDHISFAENLNDPATWTKFHTNIDRIKTAVHFCRDVDEMASTVGSALALVAQPNCPANLAILLQGITHARQYSSNPKHAAVATALFEAALLILNRDHDEIGISGEYERVIIGEKNVYLPANYFFTLVGGEYLKLQQKDIAPPLLSETEVDEEDDEMKRKIGQKIYLDLCNPSVDFVPDHGNAAAMRVQQPAGSVLHDV